MTYFFSFSVPGKFKLHAPNAQHQKLPDICLTRWVERIDGINIFKELLLSFYHYFHELKENKCEPRCSNKTLTKADSLLKLFTELVITRDTVNQ